MENFNNFKEIFKGIYDNFGFELLKDNLFEMYTDLIREENYDDLLMYTTFLYRIKDIFDKNKTEYRALFFMIYNKTKEIIDNNFYKDNELEGDLKYDV